ncbi:sugar ABC transporter substrate-binding protein [Lentzea sp. NPDC059081]|uniref:sugar ABC transporter substrate-binding protein n=1 Tax=Lentzea sp. NPDC059081 TaxID=3346719 RepID=UPI0036CD0241
MRAAALVLGLVLLSGCGTTARSDASPHVGFVVKRTGTSFAREMTSGFQEGVGRAGGVTATVTGPPGQDGHREVALFRELMTTAKSGIAVATSEPALMAPSIAEALGEDIPVVGVDMRLTGSRVKLHIGNDNHELGEKLADEVVRRLPPDATGTVVLGNTAPGLSGFDDRVDGIRERFAEKLPGVLVLGPFDTQRDDDANRDSWRRLVAANPDALAFMGTGDCDGISLAALKTEKKSARWLVGGFGVDPRTLQAVRDGVMVATISPEQYLKGALAGWLLARHATGRAALPQGWIETPGLTVTTSNLDVVLRRQASEQSRKEYFQPQIDSFVEDPASWVRPLEQAR